MPTRPGPTLTILSCFLHLLLALPGARGQCADWRPGPLMDAIRGSNGGIICSTLWDPDGAGPLPTCLVVGGAFTTIGGVAASNVAAWDGAAWHALGTGTDGTVMALTAHQNDLYVGGMFTVAGGLTANNVARWHGGFTGAWQTLGSGLFFQSSQQQWVASLRVFAGEVYAGGTFLYEQSPGQLRGSLAAWNGSAWHSPSGLHQALIGNGTASVFIRAMTPYNGGLVVAGGFALQPAGPPINLAFFNGSTFRALGGALLGDFSYWPVQIATVHGTDLIAAGPISSAGGVPVQKIAAWNGSAWRSLGTGFDSSASVEAVQSYQSLLLVGGYFTTAGGVRADDLAAWNGAAWSQYAGGLTNSLGDGARTLLPFNNTLVVGGGFSHAGPSRIPANNLASWNGSAWSAFEGQAAVYAMTNLGSRTVAGGAFSAALPTALDTASNLITWDGVHLGRFGSGLNGPVRALKSYTARLFDRFLVVGGEFTTADGLAANRIAQWSESDLAHDASWSAMGTGFNATVRAIERFNNTTYAAGDFTASGNNAVALNHIARWDATNRRWLTLAGSDLNGPCNALRAYNGSLFAGGAFTSANGTASGGLARWDGAAWSIVGGFFAGTVHCLEVFNNELVIGGEYPGLPNAPNIARYNGSTYSPMSLGTNGPVRALAVGTDGRLYVGGDFTVAGGLPAVNHLSAWSGSAWNRVSGGADGPVLALTPYRSEVQAGGTFSSVRSPALPSTGWARFSVNGIPWIASGPTSSGRLCAGDTASLEIRVADGYTANYQWRRNGTPLADGPQPSGSSVFNTHAPQLIIVNVHPGDAGSYDCTVSNDCGSATSSATRLNLCGPDVNCDGFLDFFDYDDFVAAFETGSPADVADYNGDGFADFFDYDAFVTDFETGC